MLLYPLIAVAFVSLSTAISGALSTASVYDELGPPSFRSPKNILFGVAAGGHSHVSWVIRILNELSSRGHNIIVATTDSHLKFFEPFPHIQTLSVGESYFNKIQDYTPAGASQWDALNGYFEIVTATYKPIFGNMQRIISNYTVDVIMCDLVFPECVDVANAATVPSITTSIISAPDPLTPYINKDYLLWGDLDYTTEQLSLAYRFHRKFLLPIKFYWNVGSSWRKYQQLRNLPLWPVSMFPNTDDSVKLYNNFFGTELARPMGPLVEMTGPILGAAYEPLTPSIQQFLDTHKRVVFIAFGQHAYLRVDQTEQLLVELLHMQETGVIDGILWGVGKSSFPDAFTTPSGRTYTITDLRDAKYADVLLLSWVPQFLILKHPSVITFLSHGGAMSLFEALYAGKRTVIKPFFGDQPLNALHFDRAQLGGYLKMDRKENDFEPLRRVIQDKDGVIQSNVERYQALAQIHAQHAVVRAADLVEEALFTNRNGLLPHRYDVGRKLSFLKANDYDLYLCLFTFVLVFGWSARFVFVKLSRHINMYRQENKIKSL